MGVKVLGVAALSRILRIKRKLTADAVERGVVKAGLFVQAESEEIVPVDTGAMRATAYTEKQGTGFKTEAHVGYGTDYAVFAHEIASYAHGEAFNIKYAAEIAAGTEHARRPQEQYKFLEKPLQDNKATIVEIVAAEVSK